MIEFACPGCGAEIRLPDAAAGRQGRCKTCQTICSVPRPGEAAPAGMPPEARDHHYEFAHQRLVSMAYMLPWHFRALTREALAFHWDWIGQQLPPPQRLPSSGLDVVHLDGAPAISVVTLPKPIGMPEAYFVAATFEFEGGRDPEDPMTAEMAAAALDPVDPTIMGRVAEKMRAGDSPIGRVDTSVLTLELTAGPGARPTCLCAWQTDGAHINMGAGPAPELEAFIETVRSR